MQRGASSSAQELLRASATDAVAVRHYLESIDADELNGLLDGISQREANKKSVGAEQDDWLPLVHALVRCETTRLRAASRIIQVLWKSSTSELEAMQLLTEVQVGYSLAIEDLNEIDQPGRTQYQLQLRKIVEEINVILDMSNRLLEEALADHEAHSKAIPQLLGLVPYFLGMLSELCRDDDSRLASDVDGTVIHERLVALLELPWNTRTLSFLLDMLKESSSFVTPVGWHLLQENVTRMVTTTAPMSGESMNLIIRECMSVASVTNDTKWIDIASHLFRQLPVQFRQEAEFNLQMSMQQSQHTTELVCKSIRDSLARSISQDPQSCQMDKPADWHDVVLLLHTLQSSKPILHHRSSSSRVARESSLFKAVEGLTQQILLNGWRRSAEDAESRNVSPAPGGSETHHIERDLCDRIGLIVNFGGKQTYAREWKALLLMDIALYWIDHSALFQSKELTMSKHALPQLVLLAIFQKVPEVQSEVLRSIFERTQKPVYAKVTMDIIRRLFESQGRNLFHHLNLIQDWLSLQFHNVMSSAEGYFVAASHLSRLHRGLYNFLMVFLRKLLATGNRDYQQFALNMWCTYLEGGFEFDEQQEEEIVSAIKSGFLVCATIRPWAMSRLEQVFRRGNILRLRATTHGELHRFLAGEVSRFVVGLNSFTADMSDDDDDEVHSRLLEFGSLDEFYRQDSSPKGAADVGILLQKAVSCLLAYERATSMTSAYDDDDIASDIVVTESTGIRQWLPTFVSNQGFFFKWIFQRDEAAIGGMNKSAVWHLLARLSIGSALCTVAIDLLLEKCQTKPNCFCWDTAPGEQPTSVWLLMEMEFCLNRILRKTIQDYERKLQWQVSRTLSTSSENGLISVLLPHAAAILSFVDRTFSENPQTKSTKSESVHGSGISFDALQFILDMVSSTTSDEDVQEKKLQSTTGSDTTSTRTELLGTLLSLYRNVADRMLACGLRESISGGANGSKAHPQRECTDPMKGDIVFAVYEDSILLNVPTEYRSVGDTGKLTNATILLDSKAGDELLSRICFAVGRMILETIKVSDMSVVQSAVFRTLEFPCWKAKTYVIGTWWAEKQASLLALAHLLLRDMQNLMQFDEFKKWKMANAQLCKRLCDLSVHSSNLGAIAQLSTCVTQILCEHVVYYVPLMKLLLSIAFMPSLVQLTDCDFGELDLVNKVDYTLRGCGFDASYDSCEEDENCEETPHGPSRGGKRKRLRQHVAHGETADSDSDSDLIPVSRDSRIPHLVSEPTQHAAIASAVVLVEQLGSFVVKSLAKKDNDAPSGRITPTLELYTRVLSVVRRTLLRTPNLSWVNPKVLLKMLSIIEANIRVAKLCIRFGHYTDGAEDQPACSADAVFDCVARCGAQSRTWIEWVKAAMSDSGSKTRLSATALKLDVFLLQVPALVQTLLKKQHVPSDVVDRLKPLVVLVKNTISSVSGDSETASRKKTRASFVGVVPIVRKRRKRLHSRHPIIDAFLHEEAGDDAYADLEDFIE